MRGGTTVKVWSAQAMRCMGVLLVAQGDVCEGPAAEQPRPINTADTAVHCELETMVHAAHTHTS